MAREPKQPPQTCPAINSIQKDCKDGVELMEKAEECIDAAREYFGAFVREIEDLRQQNEQLRDYGDYYFDRCRDLEEEIVQLERVAA